MMRVMCGRINQMIERCAYFYVLMIGEVHLIVCSLSSQLSDYKHHCLYCLSFMFVFVFPFWFFLFLYMFSFFSFFLFLGVLQLIKCVLDDDLQEEKRNGVPKSVHSVPGLFNFFFLFLLKLWFLFLAHWVCFVFQEYGVILPCQRLYRTGGCWNSFFISFRSAW